MKLWSICGNTQRLDGGAMFGNVPRAMWEKWIQPDAAHRIRSPAGPCWPTASKASACCSRPASAPFFEPKLRERFGVVEPEHVLLDNLAQAGFSHEDIDVVVLSHLHFDHAGGLLTAWKEGEAAQLLFPNATFIASAAHVARARDPHSRDRASFIPELLPLLEASGPLRGGRRPVLAGARQACASISAKATRRADAGGDRRQAGHGGVVFCADLIPGRAWVHLPVTMGYDRYPERLIDEKLDFLADKLERDVRLFFTHDTECAMARVRRDDKGRYSTSDEKPELRGDALPA
jgi:glyoxylase-like metal-dependent hydrolase (beta-lactamase superfamily II)